ncbi:uncharacterized protein UHOD_02945 [Ustilago sp. UG-2017b]|nr:uncharacterized protein UHOD_02945 [Ustilago sp. UG-2017b]
MFAYTSDRKARFRTAQPASDPARTLTELGVINPDESDVDFVLHAFDSALPYLASIGSEAQWGTVPFSEKPKVRESFAEYLQDSYSLNANSEPSASSNLESWQHLLIYEVQTDQGWARVAAQGTSTSFPDYIPHDLISDELRKATDYLYLNYLIVDRRTGDLAKGAGNQLVTFAVEQGKALKKSKFYGDCWRGNRDGLMKYYQKLGFQPLGPFDVKDKHGPGLPWRGYLFSKPL